MTLDADDTTMSRRGLFRAGAAGAAAAAGVAAGTGSVAAQYDGWLDDVDNYDGTHDYRGEDEVLVEVGVGDNGLRFGPAAVLIDPGATIVWEWTGEGGGHNVVANDETFNSGDAVAEGGHTFEYTFDDAEEGDTFNYVCVPHEAVQMKGVVAVGDVDDDLVTPGGEGDDEGSGDDEAGGDGDESDDGASGRSLTLDDIGALALTLGFAGALLIPLFYAAHQMAEENE
ncbi:halocyanin domain-containing protein [Halorubrum sp. DTA46]|uniref:halocyanin domain-containing protein n=1 Tax=Halorubrum sp. DTA46 TaxID=3402162 RepID=UPI003AAE4CC0